MTRSRRVDYNSLVRFDFVGGCAPEYPRSAVLRKGLARIGVDVASCRAGADQKFWARYPLLALDAFRKGVLGRGGAAAGRGVFVPEFCAKDVPLAKLFSVLTSRPLIFDPLAARYETKIVDWGWRRRNTPQAWWNFQIDAAAFRLADLILADTAAHKKYYCETYGLEPDKVEVLPLGYDDDVFSPALGSDFLKSEDEARRGFRVLFFGSFLPLHGADVVAGAARLAAAENAAVKFKMIGEGRTLQAARAAAAGAGNVEFVGRMSLTELARAVEDADLCLGIFGSTEKAQRVVPHKIFQSMAMGKPVVTLRTPAVEEFFADGRDIIFCGEPTPGALARIILDLAGDRERRERIARAGFTRVRCDFTPEAVARRLVGIAAARFGMAFSPVNLIH